MVNGNSKWLILKVKGNSPGGERVQWGRWGSGGGVLLGILFFYTFMFLYGHDLGLKGTISKSTESTNFVGRENYEEDRSKLWENRNWWNADTW